MNTKTKLKTNSFKYKTLKTLILFSCFIVIMLFTQLRLSNWYYEKYIIRNIEKLADDISSKENIDGFLSNMGEMSDFCFEVIDETGKGKIYNEHAKGCVFHFPNKNIQETMNIMKNNSNERDYYKIVNPEFKSKSLLYGIRLKNGNYVYINGQLETLDQAARILRTQMGWFVIIVFIISIIISIFISRSITEPITDITKKASKLASGNFNTKFTHSKIKEVDELAETLNYAKNELVKMNDYRRDLMANVGHDLKTPLTLIKSYAEMVRDISYKDDDKRNKHLNVIINETDRLNELVNDIITLSQIEASNMDELEITEYDLSKQITSIVNKFEILELTENYHFNVDIPKEAMVHADKKKLNQVIYNLINNAINYTGDDQVVYIKVSKQKNEYKVEIIDTGKGIDKETIKHVWDRYYKTEKKHRRNKVGTGLGLSIVREILEKHKFKYGVNSTVGKGTNFYFYVEK